MTDTFAPSYVYAPLSEGNIYAGLGLVPTCEADVPEGSVVCSHPTMTCVGGQVAAIRGTVNGHAVGRVLGQCYECRGKGYQNAADQKRNAYYWAHVWRPAGGF